jgi:hypothetical protein
MSGSRHTFKKQEPTMTEITSAAPTGEQFPLPTSQDETTELQRWLRLAPRQENVQYVVESLL